MTDEINPAPNKVLNFHNSDIDTIARYCAGKIPRTDLSPALSEYVDRMYACADYIRTYGSGNKVERMLMTQYGISRSAARQMFDRTQQLLGASPKSQAFYVDILFEDIKKGMNKALTKGDFKAHASYTKQFMEAIKEFTGSADALLYENFTMEPIIIGFFPEQFKVDLPEDLDAQIEQLKKAKSQKSFGERVGDYVDFEES